MIADHVFRLSHDAVQRRTGTSGGPRIDPGMCFYMTRCNQPEREHVTRDEYRQRRSVDA